MKRTILLALVAALMLALGAGTATAAVDGGAQTAAKKKAGKKKAAKCKAAKKKAKGKAKARKSLAAADSAAKKGKAKGKRKAKRKCAKAKAKPKPKSNPKTSPRKRVRNPYEQRMVDRYRERREQMEERRQNAPKPLTLQDVAPADGTYTTATAPGLTVTVSGNSTQARVQYTVPKSAYDAACQAETAGEAVDITGGFSIAHETKRGFLMLHASQPVTATTQRSQSVTGSIGKDGTFTLTISASFPYAANPGANCSETPGPPLTGTLVK